MYLDRRRWAATAVSMACAATIVTGCNGVGGPSDCEIADEIDSSISPLQRELQDDALSGYEDPIEYRRHIANLYEQIGDNITASVPRMDEGEVKDAATSLAGSYTALGESIEHDISATGGHSADIARGNDLLDALARSTADYRAQCD